MSNFTGKTILVVGGSSGIGLALVEQLTQQGATVINASRQAPKEPSQTEVRHLAVDVTSDLSQLSLLPDILHGLVYCPGTITLKPFHRLTEQDFIHDMQVNVLGAIKVIQASLKALKKAEGASIVLFSTVAARTGMNFHASIATAKGALEGLAVSLAAEFAPSKITVNVIAPSLTDTPLAHQLLATDEKKELAGKRHPLGRTGKPQEIAALASFLLAEAGSWMSGQVLGIDGGLSRLKPL